MLSAGQSTETLMEAWKTPQLFVQTGNYQGFSTFESAGDILPAPLFFSPT